MYIHVYIATVIIGKAEETILMKHVLYNYTNRNSLGKLVKSHRYLNHMDEFFRCCEVYEGEDCVSGGSVALKVFRRHQDYQGALQRELIFLRALATPDAPVGMVVVGSGGCMLFRVDLIFDLCE